MGSIKFLAWGYKWLHFWAQLFRETHPLPCTLRFSALAGGVRPHSRPCVSSDESLWLSGRASSWTWEAFPQACTGWGSLELPGAAFSPSRCDLQPPGSRGVPDLSPPLKDTPDLCQEEISAKYWLLRQIQRARLLGLLSVVFRHLGNERTSVRPPLRGSFHVRAAVSIAALLADRFRWVILTLPLWHVCKSSDQPSSAYLGAWFHLGHSVTSFLSKWGGSYVNMTFQASSRYRVWLLPSAS